MPVLYRSSGALAAQGELDAAIGHAKALSLKPSWAEAHNNLGTTLAKQGKADEAIAHYTAALRLRPDWALPYNNLGDAMVKQGRITEAMATFTKAAQLMPCFPKRHTIWQAFYGNRDTAVTLWWHIVKPCGGGPSGLKLPIT